MRCLLATHGSHDALPREVTLPVAVVEAGMVSPGVRSRYPALSHLPVYTPVFVVETVLDATAVPGLDLPPALRAEVAAHAKDRAAAIRRDKAAVAKAGSAAATGPSPQLRASYDDIYESIMGSRLNPEDVLAAAPTLEDIADMMSPAAFPTLQTRASSDEGTTAAEGAESSSVGAATVPAPAPTAPVPVERSFAKITRAHGYFPTLAEALSGPSTASATTPTPSSATAPSAPAPGGKPVWGRGPPSAAAAAAAPAGGRPGAWGRAAGPGLTGRPPAGSGVPTTPMDGQDGDGDGLGPPPPRMALSLGDILSQALKGDPGAAGDTKGAKQGAKSKKKNKGVPLFSTAALPLRR